ncbi:hypothetical protein [Kocuria sp. KH4]
MADIALAVVTAITTLLGPAAGPLSGGLPIVALIALISIGLAVLPAAHRADQAQEVADRG